MEAQILHKPDLSQKVHGSIWCVEQPGTTALAGRCNICGNWLTRSDSQVEAEDRLTKHLKTSHGIGSPRFNIDHTPQPLFEPVSKQ
jgi:hypothetical protein